MMSGILVACHRGWRCCSFLEGYLEQEAVQLCNPTNMFTFSAGGSAVHGRCSLDAGWEKCNLFMQTRLRLG